MGRNLGFSDKLSKSFIVSFLLTVCVPFPFLYIGFDKSLVGLFSISLVLLWTDGFLTIFCLSQGHYEANPVMRIFLKFLGQTRGVILSRIIGSLFLIVSIVLMKPEWLMAVAIIFCFVVCSNTFLLMLSFVNFPSHTDNN
jgi:hypothetical protein